MLKPIIENIVVSAAPETKLLTRRKLKRCDKQHDKYRVIPATRSVIYYFFTDRFRSFSRSFDNMISANILLAFGLVALDAVAAGPCKPVTTSCESTA